MFDVNRINEEIKRNQKDYEALKNNEKQALKDSARLERDLKESERDVIKATAELKKVSDKHDNLKKEKDRIDQNLSVYRNKKVEYERNIQNLKDQMERNLAQLQAEARKK